MILLIEKFIPDLEDILRIFLVHPVLALYSYNKASFDFGKCPLFRCETYRTQNDKCFLFCARR
jgi:hypothetical protein